MPCLDLPSFPPRIFSLYELCMKFCVLAQVLHTNKCSYQIKVSQNLETASTVHTGWSLFLPRLATAAIAAAAAAAARFPLPQFGEI